MLRKIALRMAKWLLYFAQDCSPLWSENLGRIEANARKINEKANTVAAYAEELLEENKQLRAAYDALLEEFTELTEGRTW